MGQPRTRYEAAYRQQAVDLVQVGEKSVAAIARDLGIAPATLHGWVRQARAGTVGNATLRPTERAELTRLRRQVKTLEVERELLKKAAAFFAKETL